MGRATPPSRGTWGSQPGNSLALLWLQISSITSLASGRNLSLAPTTSLPPPTKAMIRSASSLKVTELPGTGHQDSLPLPLHGYEFNRIREEESSCYFAAWSC